MEEDRRKEMMDGEAIVRASKQVLEFAERLKVALDENLELKGQIIKLIEDKLKLMDEQMKLIKENHELKKRTISPELFGAWWGGPGR
jgi:hypothetical protein